MGIRSVCGVGGCVWWLRSVCGVGVAVACLSPRIAEVLAEGRHWEGVRVA